MIKLLGEVNKAHVALVGGKAASLGEMIQAGIQVPPGFVVTTDAFRAGMSAELEKKALAAFDKLKQKRVAVRSSAVAEDSSTASWAGQLDTYLNVSRDGLIKAIQDCWQSIDSAHAQSYANENNVGEDQRAVAVVVQAMVDSEVAGVMFTANPITSNRDECVIEAVYGLGELLVQGTVTPESYVMTKASGKIWEHQLHSQKKMLVFRDGKNQEVALDASRLDKPILTNKQLSDLLAAAKQIETHYEFPQDIEWAIANNELYIVQSRPITTLAVSPTNTFHFEKTFTREESLILVEVLYAEFEKWLADVTDKTIPPMFLKVQDGLLETWFCNESTQILVDDIYQKNLRESDYLKTNVEKYRDLVKRLATFEKRQHASSLDELKQYLGLLAEAMIPLHVIYYTPLHPDTNEQLTTLAKQVRGEDALVDLSDFYIRMSLLHLYPDCKHIETMIGLQDLDKPEPTRLKPRQNNFFFC